MQIVVKITEDLYTQIKDNVLFANSIPSDIRWDITDAIVHGAPLPKGRGRWLILSEDKVKENQMTLDFSCQKWIDEVALSNSIVAIVKAESEGV